MTVNEYMYTVAMRDCYVCVLFNNNHNYRQDIKGYV